VKVSSYLFLKTDANELLLMTECAEPVGAARARGAR
jgi:hypothetical protein